METTEIKKIQGDPKEIPAQVPALKKLDVFVGKWHAEGESYGENQSAESPLANPVKWTSDESYEWLAGGFFLVHRWEARVGSRDFTGIEIIGYNEAKDQYFTHMYDNGGNCPAYKISVEGDSWTFTAASSQAIATISVDGSAIDWKWEWKKDSGDWLPLCNRTATRIRSGI